VSFDEYKKLTKPKSTLVKFFQKSPLVASGLDITRNKDIPRDIKL
jgi:hypothetical protein